MHRLRKLIPRSYFGIRSGELSAIASASLEELLGEIGALSEENRARRDPELDRRVLRARHLAGLELVRRAPESADHAAPSYDSLPNGSDLIEVGPAELTPELLRAAILRHGCLLVRGLVDRDETLGLAEGIEHAFQARSALASGVSAPAGYYEEFAPEPPYSILERPWIEEGGGVLAVDCPRVMFDTFDALKRVGLPAVVDGYLGERAGISAQKSTLRKAEPAVRGAWHQDGKFLGDVRSLNLWLSMSRCGDEAPGLDIVPRRLDHLVEAGTESVFPIEISRSIVDEAAGGLEILRPIFEPGDALLFDELFLHQTGSDPQMPKPRYALESWFFGPSAFPDDYVPLAV